MTLTDALLLLGAYVVGSIPFGVVIGRTFFGVDPRSVGSGNIGAANSLRALGRGGAALVLGLDVLKGAVPTAFALHAFSAPAIVVAGVGLATIVGHSWSIFLRFGGGKGVATGLGVLVVLSWQATLVFAVVWFVTMLATRYASLSSLLACVAAPIALYVERAPRPYVGYAVVALLIIAWRHEQNIRRLIAGTELRFSGAKGSADR